MRNAGQGRSSEQHDQQQDQRRQRPDPGQIARAAAGSVRDGLSLFDQVLAFTGEEVKDEEVAGLLGLVDDILDLSQIKAGRPLGDIAVHDLVASTRTACSAIWRRCSLS